MFTLHNTLNNPRKSTNHKIHDIRSRYEEESSIFFIGIYDENYA